MLRLLAGRREIEDAIGKARFSRSRATVGAEDGTEAYALAFAGKLPASVKPDNKLPYLGLRVEVPGHHESEPARNACVPPRFRVVVEVIHQAPEGVR
jgi:hypothetical protein